MPVITYVAQRSLIAGHSASTQYQLELELQNVTPRGRPKGYQPEALDLTRESYLYAIEQEWQIVTDYLNYSTLRDDYREFIDSVANGETFQLDFTGTIASPGTDVDMIMLSRDWTYTRLGSLVFTLTFNCREV